MTNLRTLAVLLGIATTVAPGGLSSENHSDFFMKSQEVACYQQENQSWKLLTPLQIFPSQPFENSTSESEEDDGENYLTLEEITEQISYSMNIDSPCGLSKEDFIDLLENLPYDYEGFYERNAELIWNLEQEYQVNALFVCSIVAYESGWGQYDACLNNYTGCNGPNGYMSFETESDGMEFTFSNLKNRYIDEGLTTMPSISPVYLGYESTTWADNVYSAMKMIVSY
jgi:hypothetical protein